MLVLILVAALGSVLILGRAAPPGPVAWARLETQDVHSLAFVGEDPNHLVFGHHGGVLESVDGGRTWQPLAVQEDAMSISVATDGSIIIAGHEVLMASPDGGRTWAPIQSDLPNLDIHGFTRDPGDAARMWAYLATGGLWESADSGAQWTQVREENVAFPVAIREGTATTLLGIDASGLVVSVDGGQTWSGATTPPTFPMTSLVATVNGSVVYAGSPDGLFRSTDGGNTWAATSYTGSVFAAATMSTGDPVAVVSQDGAFFRSADGGQTWPGP